MDMEKKAGLSGLVLKIIAVLSMFTDHAAKVLFTQSFLVERFSMSYQSSYALLRYLTDLGRLAFPIYAFLIAEGCRHTKHSRRYVLSLLIFGAVSEVPFWLAFDGHISIGVTNVFFTLALGAIACFAYKKFIEAERFGIAIAIPAVCVFMAELLRTDYGGLGVLLIIAAFVPKKRAAQLGCMALVVTVIYMVWAAWNGTALVWLDLRVFWTYARTWLFALSPLVLIALYSGKRGAQPAWLKWGFYAFYPLHLAVLVVLARVL